jgi:hypothetical protein
MVEEKELLDEIFGPDGEEGPQDAKTSGATAGAPATETVAQKKPVSQTVKKPVSQTVKKPVSTAVKKPVAKKPTSGGSAPSGPYSPYSGGGASPYTSGDVRQEFALGMDRIGEDSLLQSGILAYNEGRLDDALNYFAMVLITDKDNAKAKFFKAKTRERMGLDPEEKKEKEYIPTREEMMGRTGPKPAAKKPTPAAGGAGVYRMPTTDYATKKRAMARSERVVDTGLDMKRIVILVAVIGFGIMVSFLLLNMG